MSSSTQVSRAYRSIRSIVNLQTLVVAVLGCLSTWICRHLGWTGDFPVNIKKHLDDPFDQVGHDDVNRLTGSPIATMTWRSPSNGSLL